MPNNQRKIFKIITILTALFLSVLVLAQESSTPESENETPVAQEQEIPTQDKAEQNKSEENIQPAARSSGRSNVMSLGTTVKGNQEQPKVLYIVPWQAAQDDRILYQPLNSQTNRVFGHIERSEHKRELQFISELDGSASDDE